MAKRTKPKRISARAAKRNLQKLMRGFLELRTPKAAKAGPFDAPPDYVYIPMQDATADERKNAPVVTGFLDYFPDAVIAVAMLSKVGNDQHNPGEPLHWARGKSGDEANTCVRHIMARGTIDKDKVRHATKTAWRAMANLQKEIEAARGDGKISRGSQP